MPTLNWEAHRAEIERLFIEEKRTIEEIIGIMAGTHGFVASKASYERTLRRWNVRKYKMGAENWKRVARKITKGGKHAEVYCDGVHISSDRVRREISRYGTRGLTLRGKYAIVTGYRSVSTSPEPSDSLFICPPDPTYQYVEWHAESPWLSLLRALRAFGFRGSTPPQLGALSAKSSVSIARDGRSWLSSEVVAAVISASGSDCQAILQRAQSIPWAAEALRRVMPEEYSGQSNQIIQALAGNQPTNMTEESLMVHLYLLTNNFLSTYDGRLMASSGRELLEMRHATDEHILHLWDIFKRAGLELSKTFFSTSNPAVSAIRDRCLSSALALGRLDILEIMLNSGIDVNNPVASTSSPYGELPIQLAAEIKDEATSLDAVRMLLKHGAEPKRNEYRPTYDWDTDDESLIGSAITLRNWAVVETLLEAGAHVTPRDVLKALHVGNDYGLRLLDADVDIESTYGQPSGYYCLTFLGWAVKRGNLEFAKGLAARGANVNALQQLKLGILRCHAPDDEFDRLVTTTALGLAAYAGDLEMCRFLLLEEYAEIDAPRCTEHETDDHYHFYARITYRPLTIACGKGHIGIVRFLIDNGASIPLADENGINVPSNAKPESLLGIFIRQFGIQDNSQSCLDVCKLLIQKGALLDSALIAAATVKNLDLVLFFLALDAPLHAPAWSSSTKTALGAAIESGDVAIAQRIYNAGGFETGELEAIPNKEMMEFMASKGLLSPALLQYASAIVTRAIKIPDENKTLLRCILEHDIDLSTSRSYSYWPVEMAIKEGLDLNLIELLLQRGAPVRHRTLGMVVDKIATLRQAQSDETGAVQIHILNLILKYIPDSWKHGSTEGGLDSNVQWDKTSYSTLTKNLPAIITAAGRGLRDIVQMLLRAVCWGPRHVGVALTAAINSGKFLVAEDLLEMKPEPSLEEELNDGWYACYTDSPVSPLVAAVSSGRVSLARKLIERGAKVNREANSHNGGALQTSAVKGDYQMVELLLNHGADPNAALSGSQRATALQFAAIEGHLRIVHKLLSSGADVNQAGTLYRGRTAVEGAAEHGRLEILDLLLRQGGKIKCSWEGNTHTHTVWLAKKGGHTAAARLLMSQEEFAQLEDNSEREPCSDWVLESSTEDSETESSASNCCEIPGVDDVLGAEMGTYSDVSSAGITAGVETHHDPSWPNLSLIAGISETLLGEEADFFGNEEWDGWPANGLEVPGREVEDLTIHPGIGEEIPAWGPEFGFCFGDQPENLNELGQPGSSSTHGMHRNMGDITMPNSFLDDEIWSTYIAMDGGGTNCNDV
ncbi:hypothetical protein QBC42DRAFT_285970 [Cladorrhinum samala]|uniref:Clr5 domain-containing protein n=1 Tax=Cladorrhinum samala TaxID=585594 RepID=A0AAV9HT56_9PEZI|nr:hypothetical protein QBC42DRAFT_285970 [Cladorrhinum samala]